MSREYIKSQSAHGKITRALVNLKRAEVQITSLPVKTQTQKYAEIREIVSVITQLEEKIKRLEI